MDSALSHCDPSVGFFMKRQYNMCTPLGRLTDELIVEILRYCWHHQYDNDWYGTLPRSTKIPVAYNLCHRWRNVAICAPILWSTIYLPANERLCELFQERSGRSSLNITASSHPSNMPEDDDEEEINILHGMGDSINGVITRVKSLEIDWGVYCPVGWTLNQFLIEEFEGEQFTSLKKLHLAIFQYEMDEDPRATLYTPVLEELEFWGDIRWIPFVTPANLVKLVLDGTMFIPEIILDTLSLFPVVEDCTINDCSKPDFDPDCPPHQTISLGRLRRLEIDALPLWALQYLLEHLKYPASASINLRVHRNPDKTFEVEEFLGPRMSSIAELTMTSKWDIRYCVSSSPGQSFEIVPYDNKAKPGSLPFLASYATTFAKLRLDCRTLPLVEELVETLKLWHTITHISIQTEKAEVDKLFAALEDHSDLVCPLLESMDFEETTFLPSSMEQFLRYRVSQSVPLRELKITKQSPGVPVEVFSTLVGNFSQSEPTRRFWNSKFNRV
ncbi:hypothetical protein SISSUDRAFT_459177 [Sistotremastrum suecicum HHB10207 ss-3]|uniref:F-box domain-containing protein n=1 Tax=Sistotremastrum suecicum HHB10207 ss-3 TaxID=1314776 RepID=A0A165Y6G1_9AGAM|nr:hypothetical protein SISSUDRAFT_459177 [Sistotremastrum suecicum HHB10207 ss-3]